MDRWQPSEEASALPAATPSAADSRASSSSRSARRDERRRSRSRERDRDRPRSRSRERHDDRRRHERERGSTRSRSRGRSRERQRSRTSERDDRHSSSSAADLRSDDAEERLRDLRVAREQHQQQRRSRTNSVSPPPPPHPQRAESGPSASSEDAHRSGRADRRYDQSQVSMHSHRSDMRDSAPPSTQIMIRGLALHITAAHLQTAVQSHFPSLVQPLSFRIITERETGTPRGFAFADMPTIAEAAVMLDAFAQLEASGCHFSVAGQRAHMSFGRERDRGEIAQHNGGARSHAAERRPPLPSPEPWSCPRCHTSNDAHAAACSICNIARAVVAGGEAATLAMSTSLAPADRQRASYMHMQGAPGASQLPAAASAVAAPAVVSEEGALLESLTAGRVLLLSGVPAACMPSYVRDALVPYAAVRDVKLLLDPFGARVGKAFAEIDTAHEAQELLAKFAERPLSIAGAPVSVTLAGLAQSEYAAPSRSLSWLLESSAAVRGRIEAAVATQQDAVFGAPGAAGAGKHQTGVRGQHTLWQQTVQEQTALYGPAMAAAAAAAAASQPPVSARPAGLAVTFVFDPASGLWHDSMSGYYFDASRALYYHAASGWSRWDASLGRYVSADAGASAAEQAAAQYLALKTQQVLEKMQAHEATAKVPALPALPAAAAMPALESAGARAATASVPSAVFSAAVAAPASFIDESRLACLLCQRQLKSLDQLQKHESMSQLHQTNLAAWKAAHGQAASTPAAATASATARTTTTSTSEASLRRPPPPASTFAAPALSPADAYKQHMAAARALDNADSTRPLLK